MDTVTRFDGAILIKSNKQMALCAADPVFHKFGSSGSLSECFSSAVDRKCRAGTGLHMQLVFTTILEVC